MAWMHLMWLTTLAASMLTLLWFCRRRQQPLHNQTALTLLQQSNYPVCLTNSQGQILWVNQAASQLWLRGRALCVRFEPQQADNQCLQIIQQLQQNPAWQGELWLNQNYQAQLRVSRLEGAGSVVWLWQCQNDPQPNNGNIAVEDNLLFSFEHWQQYLHIQLAQHVQRNQNLSLLLLQINELSQIRRHFGQADAQQLFAQLLQRLEPALPLGSVLHRPDESRLAVLFSSGPQLGQATADTRRIALDLLAACHGPFALSHADCTLQCHVGIAIAPQAGTDAVSLQRNAGLALLQACNQDSQLHFWLQEPAQLQLPQPDFNLEQVLGQYQCQLWVQPIVRLDNGETLSYQTELRWAAPDFGMLTYAELQPLALQHGQLLALERWGFSQLCQQIKLWQQQKHQPQLQYTFSCDNMLHLGLVAFITEQLADHDLDASQLTLCCDEQAYLQEPDLFLQQANQLQQLGVRLLLSGIGEGLSALRVVQLPCWSAAELSHTMCAGLEQSDQQRNICASLVRLLVNCGLTVQGCSLQQELPAYLLHVMGVQTGRGDFFAAMQPLNHLFSDNDEWRQSA